MLEHELERPFPVLDSDASVRCAPSMPAPMPVGPVLGSAQRLRYVEVGRGI